MASQGYRDWIAAGKPFTLAAPARSLRDILRGYGYTVYDIGNKSHQVAEPPEDHMPYSATGWPVRSPRWYGFALDVMEPDRALRLPTLAQLGAQIYADKNAGHPGVAWLKYMNWTPAGGECVHDKWQPSHVRTDSDDDGHIHLSGRSDHYLTDTTDGYDPVARFRGEDDGMNPYIQHVMNYRIEALLSMRPVVNVTAFTQPNGKVVPAFSEPNVLAATLRAQPDPDIDETKLAELLAPTIRDIFDDLDDETPTTDGLTEAEVLAAIADAFSRARFTVAG